MVNVGGQKMSKSLGNFTTIRALLDSGVSPMTLRLFTLQAHYRKPLDFTAEALEAAATGWKGLNAALGLAAVGTANPEWPAALADARTRFAAAMDDDLPPPPWRCSLSCQTAARPGQPDRARG